MTKEEIKQKILATKAAAYDAAALAEQGQRLLQQANQELQKLHQQLSEADDGERDTDQA